MRTAICLVLFVSFLSPASAQEQPAPPPAKAPAANIGAGGTPFEQELATKAQQFATEFSDADALASIGEVDLAVKRLTDLAEKEKSPALDLMVANQLYNLDRTTSFTLHKRAYDAKPSEPATVLEWAMERHRKGEYAEAVPLYEQYVEIVPTAPQYNALLADCLVRQGKNAEAVAVWEAADHTRNHDAIDTAICDIAGEISPLRRRADMLRQIKAGDGAPCERLIALDLRMDQDWWNASPSQEAVEHDLPLIERVLGADSKRYKAIQCWAGAKGSEDAAVDDIKALLHEAGLVSENGTLPEDSRVAAGLIGVVVDNHIETKNRLFEKFEKELGDRARSEKGDVEALKILISLSSEHADRATDFNHYGWDRYAEARFAAGLLNILWSADKLTSESPELAQALKQFPNDSQVTQLAVRCASEKDLTRDLLVTAIKSEFHHLSPGNDGQPSSDSLDAHFKQLKKRL